MSVTVEEGLGTTEDLEQLMSEPPPECEITVTTTASEVECRQKAAWIMFCKCDCGREPRCLVCEPHHVQFSQPGWYMCCKTCDRRLEMNWRRV